MKKLSIFFFIFLALHHPAFADHITGGEMYYSVTGNTGSEYQYAVTLKLYMRCNSGRQFNNPTIISIFDRLTGMRISDITVNLSSQENISLPTNSNPCISNPPLVCFDVGYYNFPVSLPPSAHGYIIASQVNYRIAGINNLSPGYGLIGATYTAEIPGNDQIATAPGNNSAHFIGDDLVMVCENNAFSYSFAAEDRDNDHLQYSFCGAYVSGNSGTVVPTPNPPYSYVPYGSDFSESAPLGANVHINQNTGLITGTAPTGGVYVVTVCVQEIRNGIVIATQRKDVQIFIAPCSIAAAMLEPEYMLCKDTKTISISNGSNSPLIHTYHWQFINAGGTVLFNSVVPIATYSFADTGTYTVKLIINQSEPCSDSATSVIRVYPGFIPNFTIQGICFTKPTNFLDGTESAYGFVNSWSWNFGETTSANDFSFIQNPTYTYPSQGVKEAALIVTNTKGCRDTVVKEVAILDKPPINLAFRDTLICLNDQLQLHASGSGTFNWTPNLQITNANTATPVVSPVTTTVYIVNLNDNGCLNKDSVKVRVVDHVSLTAMNDTLICQGDSIMLRLISDGLHYSWTPATQFIDPLLKFPVCITNTSTNYQVTATIGSCQATDHVVVSTVPYPVSYAGPDTNICYNTGIRLQGQTDGTSYHWTPAGSLNDASILSPVANPLTTTSYVLSSFNTAGCPKPGRDTVIVTVFPKINAFAGRDTSVVVGQPLQLNATGGIAYQWFPPNYLSATNLANPIAVFNDESDGFRYKVFVFDEAHCVDSSFILVKIFKTLPAIFVPTAFTPNNDGKNDLLRPISAGIQFIYYFNIYNRWGQLIFSSANSAGWDGKVNGREQGPGTFIWVIKALDYKGNPYFQKGTVTLIR